MLVTIFWLIVGVLVLWKVVPVLIKGGLWLNQAFRNAPRFVKPLSVAILVGAALLILIALDDTLPPQQEEAPEADSAPAPANESALSAVPLPTAPSESRTILPPSPYEVEYRRLSSLKGNIKRDTDPNLVKTYALRMILLEPMMTSLYRHKFFDYEMQKLEDKLATGYLDTEEFDLYEMMQESRREGMNPLTVEYTDELAANFNSDIIFYPIDILDIKLTQRLWRHRAGREGGYFPAPHRRIYASLFFMDQDNQASAYEKYCSPRAIKDGARNSVLEIACSNGVIYDKEEYPALFEALDLLKKKFGREGITTEENRALEFTTLRMAFKFKEMLETPMTAEAIRSAEETERVLRNLKVNF